MDTSPLSPIAVVAFDRISPFHLSVPCVVFGDRHPGLPAFDFRVCAAEPGPLTTSAGFTLQTRHGLEILEQARTIIIPSWRDPAERPDAGLQEALRQAHQRGCTLVGLCLGAYVLAAAGLLDGRQATTHWAYAGDFGRRYPEVKLDPHVLYVEDGQLLTSAGTAAGLDCCLYLLRRHHGADMANHLARRLVVPPHRQGGQAQFIDQPLPQHPQDARLAALLDWVRENLSQPHSLDSLASRSHMSRRSFTRHFRQLTGLSIGQWLLAERLALSQRLLEKTDHPVDTIADLAGFGSPESLRHHFRQSLGLSPSAWRQNFRGQTPPAQ